LPDSYAARTGRPDDVGVIGVAVFRGRVPYEPRAHEDERPSYERWRRDKDKWSAPNEREASPVPPMAGHARPNSDSAARRAPGSTPNDYREPQAEQGLGTGHGERERSDVRYTEFERASDRPDEVIAIYYDSYRNLAARGIVPDWDASARSRDPRPFPDRFVPDPPRRRW
jgi:hypothetical protein